MSDFTIEYRGKIIINNRGARDFVRVKKERLPREDKLRKGLTSEGISFKLAKTNETYE
jgi:hypothetical protein